MSIKNLFKVKKVLFILSMFISIGVNAQNSGEVAQNFGRFNGFNGDVNASTIQPDGKILIGGNFTEYNGVLESRLIRLNTDGTKDSTFNIGTFNNSEFNNIIYAVTLQNDGKILVGGEFGVARLNTDGSLDSTFTGIWVSGTADSKVLTIAVQNDGKIVVGGDFNAVNGENGNNHIVRLNSNGTKDNSFITGIGFNAYVSTIIIQPDSKILVGGSFVKYNNVFTNSVFDRNITRLNVDGTKDTSFDNILGFNGTVNSIKLQADLKILVIGNFTSYNGVTGQNKIIRLNTNGNIDSSFNSGTGFSDISNIINTIAIQSDGKILIGGKITSFNGVFTSLNRILRLNIDGSKDITYTSGYLDYAVKTINLEPNDKAIVGGLFTSYNGETEKRLIRLSNDGAKDVTFNIGDGFDWLVNSVVSQPDGKILVGGGFTRYKRKTERYIIRLNTDGTKDNSFNSNNLAGFNGDVNAIAIQADGKLIVGGSFGTFDLVTVNRIIRLNTDGTKDNSFLTGAGFSGTVRAIAIQPDGKILVGGFFISFNGATAKCIIRLNSNGTRDDSFNASGSGFGLNDGINTLAIQTDGKILIGGLLSSYNGVVGRGIIRLNYDGTLDTTFVSGFNSGSGIVWSIALQSNSKILVGGQFSQYNGTTENCVIRLNSDGTKDSTFNSGSGFANNSIVLTTLLLPNGKIILGGEFTSYNGISNINRITCLNTNGSLDTTFNSGVGFNARVNVVAPYMNDRMLIGGQFITYNGDNSSVFLTSLYGNNLLSNNDFLESNNVLIWPNPVEKTLKVDINTIFTKIRIFDMNGKLLIESVESDIDVSKLSNGIYVIKISVENGEIQKKFIKQ